MKRHGLSDRLQFYPGDFLADPLPAADVHVMGRVLHNRDLATLIVFERLIDDARRTSALALLSSRNMLIMTAGGFDFTAADCIAWMQEAGFRDMRVVPLVADQSAIVAKK